MLILNAYEPTSAVGTYVVAVTAAETLLLIPYGAQSVLFSRSSRPGRRGRRGRFGDPRDSPRVLLDDLGRLPLGVVCSIRDRDSRGSAISRRRHAASPAPAGPRVHGVTMSLAPLWIRVGMYGTQSVLALTCLPLNVGLNVALIPALSIAGAAVASTVAYGAGASPRCRSLRARRDRSKSHLPTHR